ncbi:MAG: hypothetical protein LM587_01030 [Candidatus Aenigmarchaeota archaeon]|nr:hypothetical protein [Candidatus Aenigmarchaeota archaeon]
MKKLLLLFLIILFVFTVGKSLMVNVDVRDVCSIEIKSLNVSLEGLPKIDAEIYNSGSLPYTFRVLIEGENRVWSSKISEAPGDLKRVILYFLPSNETKMKIYFCNKIFEREIEPKEKAFHEGGWFSINKARVYSDFIVLEVYSNVSEEVVIMPLQYPENLIIESYVGRLKTGKNFVKINFEGEITSERNISFVVASIDGKYFSMNEVKLEKKVGLEYWFFYILDIFRIWLSRQ